jgi:NAD(P)-dependent dehydrogenase (short-subunit alcohol dehydrogenase family)
MVNSTSAGQNEKKVAIVTGASEGIGKSISLSLLENGYKVVLVSRNIEKLKHAVLQHTKFDDSFWFYPADLTDSKQVNQFIEEVDIKEGHIDILVNNLGQGIRRQIIDTSNDEWDFLVKVNLSSAFYACRAVLPRMRDKKHGSIINIASRAGRRGEGQFAGYSAMKHGLIGLTKSLADSECDYGIHVNAICPGPVATERMIERYSGTDHPDWNTPDEVAQSVLFLLSPAAAHMNGQILDLFKR